MKKTDALFGIFCGALVCAIGLTFVSACVSLADTNLPPTPQRMAILPVKMTKRQIQIQALREAALKLEQDERAEIESLEASIRSSIAKLDFSTDKVSVGVKGVSFMSSGTNLIMQVTFDMKEK